MTLNLLPVLTALIGTGGFTVGMYSFVNPTAAARIYGIPIKTSKPSFTSVLASGSAAQCSQSSFTSRLSDQDLSFIHALGIRNFTAGLSIIILTGYWHFFLPSQEASSDIRTAVQNVLGIVILVGSFVPLVDSWVCWQHSQKVHSTSRAKWQADQKDEKQEALSTEIAKQNIWVGAEWQREAYETGRKAGTLHAARSLVWIVGGLWCLLG